MTQRVSDAFACLACAALVAFYAFRQGGYFPDTPGLVAAALLVALALRVVAAERVVAAGRRRLVLAVAALALFGAWTMLSALWSDAPWRAAVESDRVLGYLAVLVLFATLRRGPRSGEWLVRGLALAALVVCGAALATRLAPDAFPTPRDVYPGRLGWPLTYWNALGLLAALGVLACVHVSASARSAALRALAAAALPVLAATLLLTFSRASLALGALAVVAYALLAWSPGAMAALVAAAGPVAVTAVATLRAGALAGDDPAGAAGQAQGHRLAIVVLGAMAAAALARIAVERAPLARLRPPRPRRALIAVAATLAVVAAAGLVAAAARDRGTATADARGHLLSASSSGRHDYWQAALGAFGHRPLDGIGAGTYELWWNAQRPRPTVVVQAHSLPLETLAELGVVGLALLVAALGGVLAAIARRARTRDAAWITLFVAAGVWLLHACIDWDWQMPAVTVWLFAAAGVALAPTAGAAATRRLPAPLRALAGLALVAGAALPSLVALSQVQLRDAADALDARQCRQATDAARLARSAVAFRAEPDVVLAWCAAADGHTAAAIRHADRAARVDPDDWEDAYADALVRATAGRSPDAQLRRAAALDPLEAHVRLARAALARGSPAQRRRRAASLPLVLGGIEYPSVSEL